MIADLINVTIKNQVDSFLTKRAEINEKTDLKTLSDFINALVIVHIRYWKFEDKIEGMDNLLTIGKLKQETNSLFKVQRPELIKSIDKIILDLLRKNYSIENLDCQLELSIVDNLEFIGSPDRFDLLYSDTLSELIDKLVIIQIRRWYLKSSLLDKTTSEITLKLDIIDRKKIPMLVGCLNKLLILIASNKVDFVPINVKFYQGVNK